MFELYLHTEDNCDVIVGYSDSTMACRDIKRKHPEIKIRSNPKNEYDVEDMFLHSLEINGIHLWVTDRQYDILINMISEVKKGIRTADEVYILMQHINLL